MIRVDIYVKDIYTNEFLKLDLFDDEKISVTSSIQNVNDISKTFTDFSQTFTIPASKNNNSIFKHWYDNSNDNPFSTLVKADAYIEIDTILFRTGKIQLESANLVDQMAANYSVTFVGTLGNLKDKFAGKFLKDLTSTTYNFNYTPTEVRDRIVTTALSSDVMFPLISSLRDWNVTSGANNIESSGHPIIFNELFPALRLSAIFKMIEEQFDISFDGTVEEPSTFLTDLKFTNAYLFLKNANDFKVNLQPSLLNNFVQMVSGSNDMSILINTNIVRIFDFDFEESEYNRYNCNVNIKFNIGGLPFKILIYKDDILRGTIQGISSVNFLSYLFISVIGKTIGENQIGNYTFFVQSDEILTADMDVTASFEAFNSQNELLYSSFQFYQASVTTNLSLGIAQYFPEMKIEDFFSGVLKMFNLTCYSKDGINYTLEQLETFYSNGNDVDITKYTFVDKKALNRVKTFNKINFEYEKSESYTNVAFNSNNGIEYGNLNFVNTPPTEGEEYSIKLPFENLLFKNLKDKLQVGYNLKVDRQKYIPKPTILYDYNKTALTTLNNANFYFSTNINGSSPTLYTAYKAFGQETLSLENTFGLNFPIQQSSLTNEVITNGLYLNYYSQYFANIFNFKARLVKINAVLPTSILTSLKLNDNIVIRDEKYLINTMNINLITGEVDFELLTDIRL